MRAGVMTTPEELGRVIGEERVTTVWLTAALFNAVVEAGAGGVLGGVEEVLAGGEALSGRHVRRAVRELGAGVHVTNGYGPTEATTFTSTYEVGAEWMEREGKEGGEISVPIGRPIGNTRVYVMEGGGKRLAATGVVGELYIGGEGLARGYVGRAEQTAERFVPDGVGDVSGERLYRTGDLMRWNVKGELEYVGRMDDQVKVRGYRIEPGEVEAVLRGQGEVKDAVVVAVADEGSGGKRLVGYVVWGGEEGKAGRELREYMKERLPDYMVPSVIVALDEMPLNANGKVDRKRLPSPEEGVVRASEEFVAARSGTEEALAEIWGEVLGVERVGMRDNYFELGGDSIRSIQVVSKGRERGLVFSIEQLFSHTTVEELARAIGDEAAEEVAATSTEPFSLIAPTVRERMPADVVDAYPLTRLQAGMVFHSELNPGSAVYHDIFSLHLRMRLDEELFRTALRDLVARHDVLRTSFDMVSFNEPLQLVHREPVMFWHVHDLTHLDGPGQERALASAFESEKQQPFDWRQAPLWRVAVYRRDDETFQLMLSLHHAIIDGWSFATLLTEWFRHYWYLRGTSAEDIAPPPLIAFHDFVRLEIEARGSEESTRYWREKLSGYRPFSLPRFDADELAVVAAATPEVVIPLPDELAAGAHRLAAQLGIPLKSVLLSVHVWMLGWLSGHDDVTTGLVTHGRPEEPDGERVLGLFLNSLPLRLRLGAGTWAELALETFRLEQEALPHRRYPLADIQQLHDGQPLFETAFGFLHFHVYQAFAGLGDSVQVLDGQALTETNFTLIATFGLDPVSSLMRLVLMYDAAQLPRDWVEATSAHYLRTLEAMIKEPENHHVLHNPLSEAERRQMLVEWNQTTTEYPRSLCLHQLFSRQACSAPDRLALSYDDSHL
ncbi:MAG: condensation domain-containing protein, partial [Pyrinomonadaceae bacterium]